MIPDSIWLLIIALAGLSYAVELEQNKKSHSAKCLKGNKKLLT